MDENKSRKEDELANIKELGTANIPKEDERILNTEVEIESEQTTDFDVSDDIEVDEEASTKEIEE